jgi:hypothetical protein
MRRISLLGALLWLCLASGGFAADPASHLLDGITCQLQMAQDGKPRDKDSLVFANGTGTSPGIAKQYQFAPGPYTATRKGQEVTFTVAVMSAEHGTVEFTGVISGATVTGKRTWSKPDKDPIVFTFTGTAAASK